MSLAKRAGCLRAHCRHTDELQQSFINITIIPKQDYTTHCVKLSVIDSETPHSSKWKVKQMQRFLMWEDVGQSSTTLTGTLIIHTKLNTDGQLQKTSYQVCGVESSKYWVERFKSYLAMSNHTSITTIMPSRASVDPTSVKQCSKGWSLETKSNIKKKNATANLTQKNSHLHVKFH